MAHPGQTRVDLRQRTPELIDALRRTPKKEAGYAPGRAPTLPAPARTVFVQLDRPEGMHSGAWRRVVAAVRMVWSPNFVIRELATAIDAAYPSIMWVVLVPAELVVGVQERLLDALQGHVAEVTWTEGTPRPLRRHTEV